MLQFFCDLLIPMVRRPDLFSFLSTRRPASPLPLDWPAPPLLAPTDDRWIEFLLAAESEFAGKLGYFRDFRAVMRGFRLGA